VSAVLGGSCPTDWHHYSITDSCFYASNTKADQPTARSDCQNMAADLASVGDGAELQFVNSIS